MGKFIRGFIGGAGCLWLLLVVILGVGGSYLARNPGVLLGEAQMSTSPGAMSEQLKELQAEDCELARQDVQRIWDRAVDENQLDDERAQQRLEQAERRAALICRT